MDVWGYLDDRRRELAQLSLAEGPDYQLDVAEEEGSNGQRGRLLGRVWLNDEAFVEMHETFCVEGEGIHREKYAYFLCIGNDEIGGYERDPSHDPAEHAHCSQHTEHERTPAGQMTFKGAIKTAWDYLSGYADEDAEP